ncbi:MAG TPA: hypothetical protein VEK07_14245 [Polyangiaceae bacterium]|nr:hypothetical protein [Polyangiaceae bacterium]
MAKLKISTQAERVASGAPFRVVVDVDSGPPGQDVRVSLRQTQGAAPLFSALQAVVLDSSGEATADFPQVVLSADHGTTSNAVLLATAVDDGHTFFNADARHVQVEG